MNAVISILDCQVGSLLVSPSTSTRFELVVLIRSLFPLIPVTTCLALAMIGHVWSSWCLSGLVGSAQIWYWISFLVVAYPFAIVFGTNTFKRISPPRFVLGLFAASLGISLFEAALCIMLGSRELAWAAGYSLYTVVGLLAVPMFFYVDLEKRDNNGDGKLGSRVAMIVTMFSILLSLVSTWSYTARAPARTGGGTITDESIRFSSFDDWLGKKREHEVWQTLILYMLPAQALVLVADRKRKIQQSFAYCVFYSVLGTRVPDFLAYSTVHIFMQLGAQADQVAASRVDEFYLQFTNVGRFTLSMGYMLCMSMYMRLLARITQAMSTSTMYPRFMFHAQLYFYTTYYVLVSSTSRDMDWLFWAMIAALNSYYVASSTGLFQEWRDHMWNVCWDAIWRCCCWCCGCASLESQDVGGDDNGDVESSSAPVTPPFPDDAHNSLVTRIQLADQDALADITALVTVPTLITAFAIMAARDALDTEFTLDSVVTDVHVEHYNGATLDIFNLWMRFGVMFLSRLVSSRASRFIFRTKMNKILASTGLVANNTSTSTTTPTNTLSRSISSTIYARKNSNLDSVVVSAAPPPPSSSLPSTPSKLQHQQSSGSGSGSTGDEHHYSVDLFPYYLLVSVHSMYSLFQNPDLPARYAFCSTPFVP